MAAEAQTNVRVPLPYLLPERSAPAAVARRAGRSYTRSRMRRLALSTAVLVAALAAGGCASEKPRPVVGEDEITAAHLKALSLESPWLRYLEPDEDEARAIAEEQRAEAERDPNAGDGLYPEERTLRDEEDGTQDKFGQASVAILQVAIVLGAMVAPYFLF
jgi:hypothetical protein